MKRPNCFYIILFCFLFHSPFAQQTGTPATGANIGLVIGLGNRFDRIGINLNAYCTNNFLQLNAGLRLYYNFKNLGPPVKYCEGVASLGVTCGYGKKDTLYNRFIDVTSNQTKYRNSVGYAYNCYFNKINTTQQTGIVALQFNHFSIISENDILARPMLDRFRTGAFLLQYQYKDFQFAVNSTLWTGQMGNRIKDSVSYPHRNGYMDTTGSVYSMYSHGLLSMQVKYCLPYYQYAQVNIGTDAEQVRHFVQNRVIHDLCFIPRKLFTPINAHIPMVDDKGCQYLFKEGQKIKPAKFYYNAFLNPATFY